jgi:hypothetical protein
MLMSLRVAVPLLGSQLKTPFCTARLVSEAGKSVLSTASSWNSSSAMNLPMRSSDTFTWIMTDSTSGSILIGSETTRMVASMVNTTPASSGALCSAAVPARITAEMTVGDTQYSALP